MNAPKNFEIAASALYNEAPSQKARDFVDRLANQIRAKGEAWITANVTNLHIEDFDVADTPGAPSIEENRLYYLSSWQVALSKTA